ncbi:hypothetical protein [Lacihabitans soyangensis]|uniref:Uncharacterized protein n=1 Tax=Lacihabitans soyangensis TaxID=869394 RepID=A0AAE3H748_9BACT|nr:hypothetical protein [Lacihabitans soyangensis]MCP9765296.1 hypothetical protein [Lacihabitans soyangensis]
MTIKINKNVCGRIAISVFLITLVANFEALAQKVKPQREVASPVKNNVALSVYDDYVAKQIKADSEVIDLNSSINNGLDNGEDIERSVLDRTTYEATFRISKDKLTKFLYDPSFTGEKAISGLMIEFGSEKTDLNIFRVGELVPTVGYKSIEKTFMVLKSTDKAQFGRISPFASKNLKDIVPFAKSTGVRGYFIGRNVLYRKLVSESGFVKNDIASLEIEVRFTRDMNKVLILKAIKSNKSVELLGMALHEAVFQPVNRPLTKMGGSRPCPTYCRQ